MRRILVAEDDPSVRAFLRRSLERHGWVVTVCISGRDALATLAAFDFDVVLTDLELGSGPSGLDIVKQRPERNRDKRYVILTGYGTQARCREALLSGASDFLDKPVAISTLLLALQPRVDQAVVATELGVSESFPVISAATRHVRAVIGQMERRYSERDLTIETLANAIGISLEHLSRLFHRQLGRSPLRHLHDLRVARAKQLLLNTSLSVYAIARECGYHSTSELDVHFGERSSCTPTAFRSMGRTGEQASRISNGCQESEIDFT